MLTQRYKVGGGSTNGSSSSSSSSSNQSIISTSATTTMPITSASVSASGSLSFAQKSPYYPGYIIVNDNNNNTATNSNTYTNSNNTKIIQYGYQNSTISGCYLLVLICIILTSHTNTTIPLQIFLLFCLVLYCIDLCTSNSSNNRSTGTSSSNNSFYIFLWISVIINTLTSLWCWLLYDDKTKTTDDNNDDGWIVVEIIFKVGTTAIVYILCALWITIHIPSDTTTTTTTNNINKMSNHNNNNNNDDDFVLVQPIDIETTLHTIVPPLFASYGCQFIVNTFLVDTDTDDTDDTNESITVAYLIPYIFLLLLLFGMITIGSSSASTFYEPTNDSTTTTNNNNNHNNKKDYIDSNNNSNSNTSNNKIHNKENISNFAIRYTSVIYGHIILLLFVPPIVHFCIFVRSIHNDLTLFILSITIPYIILYILLQNNTIQHPYRLILMKQIRSSYNNSKKKKMIKKESVIIKILFQNYISFSIAVLVSSMILHQQYFLPLCRSIAYSIEGTIHTSTNVYILTLYWFIGTILVIFVHYIWGRQQQLQQQYSVGTTSLTESQLQQQQQVDLIFGEYHDDIVQFSLCCIGVCFGKAFGVPWNMIPLPVLAMLGLSIWITTRLVRYLSIVLFVIHATAIVIFTYKYAGIEQPIILPFSQSYVFGIIHNKFTTISLVNFALVVTFGSILIGLVAGFSIRPKGGYMSRFMKRYDINGQLFVLYMFLLTILEISLSKVSSIAPNEVIGVDMEDIIDDIDNTLYEPELIYITSILSIGLLLFMYRYRMIYKKCTCYAISIAIGKSIAIVVDEHIDYETKGSQVLYHTIITSFFCIIIYSPKLFLQPIYRKSNTYRNKGFMWIGRNSSTSTLPHESIRIVLLYTFVLFPIALLIAVPTVLLPLITLLTEPNDTYHKVRIPISELIGAIVSIWGLSCLSMLHHYLPDSGGEAWKKLSSFSFIVGIIIFFAAPTIGMNTMVDIVSNPYSSLSSVGSQIIDRSKSRTGGWGLLSSTIAVLLAITGPLELRERQHIHGAKDTYLLFRTMTFSILFGCGVAWFITVTFLSETSWLVLFLVLVASMIIAFVGTIASVFGHYLELSNFNEVEQLSVIFVLIFTALLFIAGIPQIIGLGSITLFGFGGWLSTYLTVTGLSTFQFTIAVSTRTTKDKRTRGLGNVACIFTWVAVIISLYGSFGIAGIVSRSETHTIFGMPLAIAGTIVVSPILLLLDGEMNASKYRSTISAAATRSPNAQDFKLPYLNLNRLHDSNNWFPPFISTMITFLITSLYVILLRGSTRAIVAPPSIDDLMKNVLGTSHAIHDVAVVQHIKKALLQSMIQQSSQRLSGCGFWTSTSIVGPIVHLLGVLSCLPTLYQLYTEWWRDVTVTTNVLFFTLPLNIIPLVLCPAIPGLRVAALCNILAGSHHLYTQYRRERLIPNT